MPRFICNSSTHIGSSERRPQSQQPGLIVVPIRFQRDYQPELSNFKSHGRPTPRRGKSRLLLNVPKLILFDRVRLGIRLSSFHKVVTEQPTVPFGEPPTATVWLALGIGFIPKTFLLRLTLMMPCAMPRSLHA